MQYLAAVQDVEKVLLRLDRPAIQAHYHVTQHQPPIVIAGGALRGGEPAEPFNSSSFQDAGSGS